MYMDIGKCYWSLRKASLVNELLEAYLAKAGKSIKEESISRRVSIWSLSNSFSSI